MITVRQIDHLVIRVKDMDRMVAFYRDVLGCPLEKVQEEFGLWQLRAGTGLVDLVDVDGKIGREGGPPPESTGGNMDHFCLEVDDWDEEAIRRHLDKHKIEYGEVAERYGATGYGPSIYLTDPEGNIVELKSPISSKSANAGG